jgi:hypothetical protein
MKTWQLYQSTAVVRNPEDHDVVEVDRGVRQEVVTVLTNMILSHQ